MSLKIDFCSYEAAKHACLNWHYSKSMPTGKLVKFGIWEEEKFIGAIIYGRGANNNIVKKYNLKNTEGCELVRIAMRKHETPVSKCLVISLNMLKKFCPGLNIIVSYADIDQDHHGGIYQATNWIYEGVFCHSSYLILKGKRTHNRTINAKYGSSSIEFLKKHVDPNLKRVESKGKHKYIYPLTKEIREIVEKLSKPYPKRLKQAMDADHASQRECDTHLAAPRKC